MLDSEVDVKYIYNPNLDEVSELMSSIWQKPHWDFTPDVLSGYIDRPSGDPTLSLGVHCNDQLAGFAFYQPFRVKVDHNEHPVVMGRWWTTDQQFKSQNVALKLHEDSLSNARKKGYVGFFAIIQKKSMADMSNRYVFAYLKETFKFITAFSHMAALPGAVRRRTQNDEISDVSLYSSEYKQECMQLINSANQHLDIVEIVPEVDVDYILKDRPLAKTWIYRKNSKITGVFNIVQKSLLSDQKSVNACIEKIAFNGMSDIEIRSFIKTIMLDPYWDTIDLICIADLGHFDKKLFESMGFHTTRKEFSLYYIPLNGQLDITRPDHFYLDVF